MKRLILPVWLCLLLAACGDASDQTENSVATDSTVNVAADAPATAATDISTGLKASMDNMMAQMNGYAATGDADQDFAAIMRLHHQGAVDMMQTYLPGAKDEMLKGMAQSGLAKQQGEIGELDAFLNNHKTADKKSSYGTDAKQMIVDMMKMDNMPSDADKAFATMMIPHHESAVHVSQMYANEGKDKNLLAMAKKIATEQQKEVDDLKKWVAAHP